MEKTRLSQEAWRRVEEVYHEALEHRPESRAAFVTAAADSSLRREVESLPAADRAERRNVGTTERSNTHL